MPVEAVTETAPERHDRRYASLLIAGLVAIALWTLVTTLYVDWLAYSPLPWGDHWDHWRQYIAHSGLTPQFLFSAHNEHRIATSRLLFWIDQHFFSARNSFLYSSVVAVQLAQAGLLWWLGVRSGSRERLALPLGALALTAAFSAQQFTNFTWAFQVQFVIVFLFAHAAFAALWLGNGRCDDEMPSRARPWWLAAAIVLAWLSTYSMSNGLLVWPLMVLLGLTLGMPWRALAGVGVNGAAAWLLYFYDLPGTRSMIEGIYQLPRSLTYALVVLGLPVDDTASALMRTFGLAAPQYPGLGGDSLAMQAWRPIASAAVGALGVAYTLSIARGALLRRSRPEGAVLVLLHCALFTSLTAVLVGIGRSPSFDIVTVMQSRYATPALLFWACVGSLFLVRGRDPAPGAHPDATEQRLQTVLLALALTVGINQPSKFVYARGYADYLGEVQEAMAAEVYSPEVWGRVYGEPAALVPILDYFERERLSLFSLEPARWRGQLVGAVFRVTDGCVGHLDDVTPQPSGVRPGVRVRGWAWDDRDRETADAIVLTDRDGRILGVADTVFRRDDVTTALPDRVRTPWVGWRGFVPAAAAAGLQAYLLRDEDRTACKVGGVQASNEPAAR